MDGSVGGNSARWLNHFCRPNRQAIDDERRRGFIGMLRDVVRGDELSTAYRLTVDGRLRRNWPLVIHAAVERSGVPV
ncbi:SET domain-containing protein-lysine N-methyltransferase [Paraburkholderia strydomiana]|uniref:SET domain-containing protein-lysine N-methyltransferase n=1 Tax=Paraburkholderia strydomiana TaxID=1245417 RepID=UPI0035B536CE